MVKISLKVSFTAENLTSLKVRGPDFDWNLKIKCAQCNEIDENWHAINENDEIVGKKGHSTSNFNMKCKFCSNVGTLDVVKDSIKPIEIGENGSVKDETIATFDCRGIEPVEFDPQSGWIARNNQTDSIFENVDFIEESTSWYGYDEKGKVSVSIEEFSSKFARN